MASRIEALLILVVLGSATLAGCSTKDDEDDMNGTTTTGTTTTNRPAPQGDGLSSGEIAALVATFNDQPFAGAQGSPAHRAKWVSNETFIFLHFDKDEPLQATKLLWIGIGIKGVFCEEDQPDSAFTHFHKYTAASWEAGHGGAAGEQGYWLMHVAVTDIPNGDMMAGTGVPWGPVVPGVDYEFMPTDPSACSPVPDVDFDPTGAEDLSQGDVAALVTAFSDDPFEGGQTTPMHVWKWVNSDVHIFLHFDQDQPVNADNLLWYGIGKRGEMCAANQPDTDFTHFHKWNSASWEAGHGGAAHATGYWLLHGATREIPASMAPWGPVEVGVDREFMPTPPPAC